MAELLVSLSILLIIAVAVAGDINRTKFQEELSSSARVLAGALRDLQARALASTGAQTCPAAGGVIKVCEADQVGCAGACFAQAPPYAVGAALSVGATAMTRFAEVDVSLNDRRPDAGAREDLGGRSFLESTAGTGFVKVQSLVTEGGGLPTAVVTFERQNGAMRINACDTPPPNTPPCGGLPEPKTLAITLVHQRTNQTRTVRLNTITGKISLE